MGIKSQDIYPCPPTSRSKVTVDVRWFHCGWKVVQVGVYASACGYIYACMSIHKCVCVYGCVCGECVNVYVCV